uniref:Uncharacterized protein n=1 Tax=Panagrolaimus davidi TaxID=227884 RepID=A0A914QWC0_9BILA
MAPPPKKGPLFAPYYWSGWVDTPSCDCLKEEKFAYKYEWMVVQMVSNTARALCTTVRVVSAIATAGITEAFVHKKDLTHECVVVWYKCNKCDHKFAIQYETDNADDGRFMYFGHFENHLKIREFGEINYHYDFVQKCFGKMWGNYKLFGHNCYHWAKDFSCKLRLADSDAYVYGYNG